ncbi:MAG: twin-arginine translocation pathway signal [Proteobacteria bacterium]|nr:twin-arginine translocation pathway signal [Pseudomonadota bacterium]
MTNWTRRGFIVTAGASLTSACSGGTESNARFKIDSSVEAALRQMQAEVPFTTSLVDNAAGMLVMPKITKGSFIFGGSYGEGSLLVGNAPVDYYNTVAGSWGLQAGVSQVAQVLFFMDQNALQKFRSKSGWTLGADLEYTLIDKADSASMDTNTVRNGVYSVVFDQSGVLVGISLEGSKYNRVIR